MTATRYAKYFFILETAFFALSKNEIKTDEKIHGSDRSSIFQLFPLGSVWRKLYFQLEAIRYIQTDLNKSSYTFISMRQHYCVPEFKNEGWNFKI